MGINYNPFKGALICSLVVIAFGLLYHGIKVNPYNWVLVALWLPVYISPLWVGASVSYLSERRKKE